MSILSDRLIRWDRAEKPEELFGGEPSLTAVELKKRYRKLLLEVHPDHNPAEKQLAEKAFFLLQKWYDIAVKKLDSKSYGRSPIIEIVSKNNRYVGYQEPVSGDLSDIFCASDQHACQVIIKILHHPKNNDLIAAEKRSIQIINRQLALDPLRPHFPTFIEQVKLKDKNGAERLANVLMLEKGTYSLADVKRRFPSGVDPADGAWMFHRLLAGLAKTHELGLVHGAVLPTHLLIRPEDHNGILIDWCYSVEIGDRIQAISPPYQHYYPPEVLAKRPASAATDVYMAAMTMLEILGGDGKRGQPSPQTPPLMAALLKSCLIQSPHRRPQDAWEVFEQSHSICKKLFGKPVFREFEM